jgi:hypothetical protein
VIADDNNVGKSEASNVIKAYLIRQLVDPLWGNLIRRFRRITEW